jgi:hypothetical protein
MATDSYKTISVTFLSLFPSTFKGEGLNGVDP